MKRLSKPEHNVLTILHGCPNGATEFNLVTRHAIKPATLYLLIERGLIRPENRMVRPPYGFQIIWVILTENGHAMLARERATS
jgi:hypothetical protein